MNPETNAALEAAVAADKAGSESAGDEPADPDYTGLSMYQKGGGGAEHNFVGSPMEQFRMAATAAGSNVKPGDEMIGEVINVRFWYVHPVTIAGEDGKGDTSTFRVVLFDQDGTPYQFVSLGILDGLNRLLEFFGRGELNPPIAVVPEKKKTRRGRTFFTLEPAPE